MNSATPVVNQGTERGKTIGAALLQALPMMLLTGVMLSGGKFPHDKARLFSLAVTYVFLNVFFFLMVWKGKTDRYRAPLFITYAVAFVISFVSHLIEERGSMALTGANMIQGETPFCHIVIPMTLIPAALTKTIIFPGTIVGREASIAGMFALWIGAALALGRGFCSWACFFGGLEDGFSRIFRKARLKFTNPIWSYLPFAVLLAVALLSAVLLYPVYCSWLCPFKTVTEYPAIVSTETAIQAGIFVTLFVGLVVVLPMLTKKRTQCSCLCPFGAFQSFTNKVNSFDIRIDQQACVKCGRCISGCPTLSLDEASLERGRARITCTKCGKCVDDCPKKAISFHAKGTPPLSRQGMQRLLFLYPAFLFLAIMGGGCITDAVTRLIRLVTTGTLLAG